MTDQQAVEDYVLLEPDGRVIFPEEVMRKYVLETKGGNFWWNDQDQVLGLRLLRGEDKPPYVIERIRTEDGGLTGTVPAGSFLEKTGWPLPAARTRVAVKFFPKYHLLVLLLSPPQEERPAVKPGRLADHPALED